MQNHTGLNQADLGKGVLTVHINNQSAEGAGGLGIIRGKKVGESE